MNEKQFEKKVITAFRKNGLATFKMDLPSYPGFPDLAVYKGDKYALVELKVIREKDLNRKVKSLFQPSQIPFYRKYCKDMEIILMSLYKNEISYEYISKSFLEDIVEHKIKDFVDHVAYFRYTAYNSIAEEVLFDLS